MKQTVLWSHTQSLPICKWLCKTAPIFELDFPAVEEPDILMIPSSIIVPSQRVSPQALSFDERVKGKWGLEVQGGANTCDWAIIFVTRNPSDLGENIKHLGVENKVLLST